MGGPKRAAILCCWFFLGLGSAAQAYHFDTIYGPDANYAYGEAFHYTSQSQFTQDTKEDSRPGVATAHALMVSGEVQVGARPAGGTDPAARINLNVNGQTTYYSFAYGYTNNFWELILVKDPGDTANRAWVTLNFSLSGAFNLEGGATSQLNYALKVDGRKQYGNSATYTASGTLDQTQPIKVLLTAGVPHTLELTLEGDLDHASQTPNDACYTVNLVVGEVQPARLVPAAAIFLLLAE